MNLHRTEQHTFIGLAPAVVNIDSSDRAILWGPIFSGCGKSKRMKCRKSWKMAAAQVSRQYLTNWAMFVEVVWQPRKKIDRTETLTGDCTCQT